jgi:DNA polymerase III epsilon subunit-like protein
MRGRTVLKIVFIDAEVTGEHARTTLVSVGMVTIEGESLYVTFNDYDRDQIYPWLEEHVLSHIDKSKSVTSEKAFELISNWLEEYSGGEEIRLVSAGLGADLFLVFELYKYAYPERKFFHALHCLPDFINHSKHMDLNTLFQVTGLDPGMNRAEFAEEEGEIRRHDALSDAMVVRKCFMKLTKLPQLGTLCLKTRIAG